MITSYQFCLLFLAVFVAFFPIDASNGAMYLYLWCATRVLNYYLMFRAYMMYRRLRSDFGKMGMPFPAFKFVPIWERDGSN